jgi:hypothetical protein
MSKLILANINKQVFYSGDTQGEIVNQIKWIQRDWEWRRLVIHGQNDTVAFCSSFLIKELAAELNRRAMHILIHHYGYSLYEKK